MNRIAALSLHIGLLLVLFLCIADCLFLKDTDQSRRHKRGFRSNAAQRMAHGYGKRDYHSPSKVDSLYSVDGGEGLLRSPLSLSSSAQSPPSSEARGHLLQSMAEGLDNSPLLSAQEFTKLITGNEGLANVIVRKFIDVNDDGIISNDELFRRVRE